MVLSYDADAKVFPFGANLIAFISSSCVTLDVKDSFISIISSVLELNYLLHPYIFSIHLHFIVLIIYVYTYKYHF